MFNKIFCRYCGEEIETDEMAFITKNKIIWVHSQSKNSAGYKCVVCGQFLLYKTWICPRCTAPSALSGIDHYAEPKGDLI